MLRPYICDHTTQFRYMRSDLDPELPQQLLADSSARHTRDGLARAGALEDVARVHAVVFERTGEIGVAGARPGDLAPATLGIGRRVRFRRHDVLPVLPVAIPDEHGDGGAECFAG